MNKFNNLISRVGGLDKVAHAAVAAVLFLLIGGVLNLFWKPKVLGFVIGGFVVVFGGMAKEAYDAVKGGDSSIKDFIADAIGLGIGIIIAIVMYL